MGTMTQHNNADWVLVIRKSPYIYYKTCVATINLWSARIFISVYHPNCVDRFGRLSFPHLSVRRSRLSSISAMFQISNAAIFTNGFGIIWIFAVSMTRTRCLPQALPGLTKNCKIKASPKRNGKKLAGPLPFITAWLAQLNRRQLLLAVHLLKIL